MFGKFSPKSLALRVFFWLVVLLLLTMLQFFQSSTLIENIRIYYGIRMVATLFLMWHGCDVLYRFLAACDRMGWNR